MLKESTEENLKENIERKRTGDYQVKQLHGQFERATKQDRNTDTWLWLRKGALKKETDGLITAAWDLALRTNSIIKRIDGEEISPLCRMCREREETIRHIVTEWEKLAQKEYKGWRDDRVGKCVLWRLCQKFGFDCSRNWQDQEPKPV